MRIRTLVVTFFALFCGWIGLSTEAHAQAVATSKSTTLVPRVPEKLWDMPISFEIASTMQKQESYERQTQATLGFNPMYRLSSNWVLAGDTSFTQDNSIGGNGNVTFDNTNVSLSTTQELSPTIAWRNSFGGVLPTDQTLRDQTTYAGAVKIGTGFIFDGLVLGSTFSYKATLTRNFHGYDMTADGIFNIRDSLSQGISYELPVSRSVAFVSSLMYVAAQTYQDDLRTKFSMAVAADWSPNRDFTFEVGVGNEGDALKPNGRDSNIQLFDDTSTAIKASVTYNL